MDQKAWIAAIIGLIVGVLLGVFVCAGGNPTAPPGNGDKGDPPPPLPSVIVESMPSGTWPKIECSPGSNALSLLDEICTLAWDAKNGDLCTPEQWMQIYSTASQIAMNPALQGSAPAHCTKLDEAKTAALNNEWQMAIDHLEHIH